MPTPAPPTPIAPPQPDLATAALLSPNTTFFYLPCMTRGSLKRATCGCVWRIRGTGVAADAISGEHSWCPTYASGSQTSLFLARKIQKPGARRKESGRCQVWLEGAVGVGRAGVGTAGVGGVRPDELRSRPRRRGRHLVSSVLSFATCIVSLLVR